LTANANAPFDVQTPALLVDQAQFAANIDRLKAKVDATPGQVRHRPHLKTVKSVELARQITEALDTDAITVSTLKEAEIFAEAGFRDILYAVGITPAKLDRVVALQRAGVDLTIITDNLATAKAIGDFCNQADCEIPVLIEVDVDGHRSGVLPEDSDNLLAIAATLSKGAELRGVMTHAGGSYDAQSEDEMRDCAALERTRTLVAAQTLREAGYLCPLVSIGSTPTALHSDDLSGVSELRAGVYAFFDLVMAGLGVCHINEIALSVLTTVIGHQRDKGWTLVDAGWMAMSRDRGTANQPIDQRYGLVCDASGRVIEDGIMISANQEHGILAVRPGSDRALPDWPVGTQLRVLPNHACATAAQHSEYLLVDGSGEVLSTAERFNGW
jgi:D-serine deaminase-like pyridoxal phosphate-dependent protein